MRPGGNGFPRSVNNLLFTAPKRAGGCILLSCREAKRGIPTENYFSFTRGRAIKGVRFNQRKGSRMRISKTVRVGVFLLLAGLLLSVSPAAAQQTSGMISGVVEDGQGAVVPGANVTVINQA